MARRSKATDEPTDRGAHHAEPLAERGPDAEKAGSQSPQGDGSDRHASEPQEEPSSVPGGESSAAAPADVANPPLPNEPAPPPLPDEPTPAQAAAPDDGWEPIWEPTSQAFYFFNRITQVTQWENPRAPETTETAEAPVPEGDQPPDGPSQLHGGYNPAIHGSYDPTAAYAVEARAGEARAAAAAVAAQPPLPGQTAEQTYDATGHFNRFTGRWQAADINPDNHNDEAKSGRQMNAFFDVAAAANTHDGRSLRAERSGMKLSKAELKAFKEKRRERKEEKRRAWLRD